MTTAQPAALSPHIALTTPGHALPRAFYTDPAIYAHDLDLLQRHWIYAGHVSALETPGDWITAQLGAESAIIVRDAEGVLRAHANVCRHRGSQMCVGDRGSAKLLICPYHGWSYGLDGALRGAPQMPDGFDRAAHGLVALPLEVIGGLIFISFDAAPPSLARAAPALQQMTTRYRWADARVAHRETYRVAANWKLDLENYHECYHCTPAHPEFAALHALARPGNRSLITEADASGYADIEDWGDADLAHEMVRVMRSALGDGVHTGSRTGALMAPLMGPDDGHCVFAELGPLSAFLAYADHGVIYRFVPVDVQTSEIEVIWLVAGSAEAGRDYDAEALIWLWHVTSLADKRIIETNQAGVTSRHYRPGPYSLMEPGAAQYVARYVAELAAMTKETANAL